MTVQILMRNCSGRVEVSGLYNIELACEVGVVGVDDCGEGAVR